MKRTGGRSNGVRDRGSHSGSSSRDTETATERGALEVGKLFVAIGVLSALVLAGALVGPQALATAEDVTGTGDDAQIPDAGDRNPELTDPGDPGETTYQTDETVVSSDAVEDHIHEIVNEKRAEHGLEPLDWDGTVASVSRAHSWDMYETGEFSHINTDGESPHERFQAVADYCQVYGENIAETSVGQPVERASDGETVEHQTAEELAGGIVDQWMNSPDHRAAILEEDVDGWDRGGVGIYISDEGRVFATHNFCTLR
ncbi:CAP domain-containing protein [Natrialbaceae archaeon A-chndr2]